MRHIANRFLVLTHNESYYAYKNDVTLVRASLILDVHSFELRLNFTKFHISDTEPQTKTHLSSYNVGTFFKPQKRLINGIFKDHTLRARPFWSHGWVTDYSKTSSVTELFIDLKTKDYLIMRAIKLMRIKKLIKRKKR